jgi:hypothetical protein
MGDIYGRGYLRSPDNQIVYNTNGSPILDTKIKKIGNYNQTGCWVCHKFKIQKL